MRMETAHPATVLEAPSFAPIHGNIGGISNNGGNAMKIVISMFALLALSGMAYAADKYDAKTEADCVKAGGVWIAASQDCEAKGGQEQEKELQEETK